MKRKVARKAHARNEDGHCHQRGKNNARHVLGLLQLGIQVQNVDVAFVQTVIADNERGQRAKVPVLVAADLRQINLELSLVLLSCLGHDVEAIARHRKHRKEREDQDDQVGDR